MADVLGDRRVVEVLDRAVWGINPVLDLAYSDPFGIKRRTFEPTDSERNAAEAVLDAVAWVLDVIKFPGTAAWSVMTDVQRSKWWTTRLGALNTVAVAFPEFSGFCSTGSRSRICWPLPTRPLSWWPSPASTA